MNIEMLLLVLAALWIAAVASVPVVHHLLVTRF